MKFTAHHANQHFVIEEDLPEIGWYLLVYNGKEECLSDYLQESQEMAKEFAYEEFDVPLSAWKAIEN